MRIKVYVERDGMGTVFGYVVSDRWAKRFASIVRKNGGGNRGETFYFQGDAADEFIDQDVPPRHRSAVRDGFGVTFLADPWDVGHWFGYDAHTAAEQR